VFTPKVARSTDDGSSWSQIAITNSFTDYALSCGQAVEAANGDIVAAMYGEDTGDSFMSVRVSRSTDDGATWAHLANIADGDADSRHYQEPALLRLANDDILCFMRTSADVYYWSTSTDDGATWSAASAMSIPAASGRPGPLLLSDGKIALWNRHPVNPKCAFVRFSSDTGSTWTSPLTVSFSAVQGVYAQMIEISSGVIALAYADEAGNTSATVKFTYLLSGETDVL
jgi:hypothetical protein